MGILGGTRRKTSQVTPTISAAAYSANDQLGGIMSIYPFEGAGNVDQQLESIGIMDIDKQGLGLNLLFFNSLPTLTSADGEALAFAAGQESKLVFALNINDPFTTFMDVDFFQFGWGGDAFPYLITGGETIYVVAQVTSTPTFTTTSSVRFDFHMACN